jgi:valyl-tRNA synthetase
MPDGLDLQRSSTVPDKPALEGLEQKWTARWESEGVYRFDRTK